MNYDEIIAEIENGIDWSTLEECSKKPNRINKKKNRPGGSHA
jgi:hypothetical protein